LAAASWRSAGALALRRPGGGLSRLARLAAAALISKLSTSPLRFVAGRPARRATLSALRPQISRASDLIPLSWPCPCGRSRLASRGGGSADATVCSAGASAAPVLQSLHECECVQRLCTSIICLSIRQPNDNGKTNRPESCLGPAGAKTGLRAAAGSPANRVWRAHCPATSWPAGERSKCDTFALAT
jgi:hypothetical protein